jgi:hypothetical protein
MIVIRRLLLLSGLMASATSGANHDNLQSALRSLIPFHTYQMAKADLNGDGRPEILVLATDAGDCGNGGCAMRVISPTATGYRIVLRGSIMQPDIGLAATRTRGWRDIVVHTNLSAHYYQARLKYDGRRYPANPTVPPATQFRGQIKTIVFKSAR